MDVSHWAAAIKTKIPLCPEKVLAAFPQLIPAPSLCVIMLDCCNFRIVAGFASPWGGTRRQQANRISGSQPEC